MGRGEKNSTLALFATCRALTIAALSVAFISLSGCVVIPIPDHQVFEGAEITPESLTWLHVGETTRSQVIEKLGAPDVDFVDQHVIAYAWSGKSSDVSMMVLIIGPGFSGGGAYGGGQPIRMRRAFMIRFDLGDKVAVFSIIDRPTTIIPYDVLITSVEAHYDDWRVILDRWLADQSRNFGQSGVKPK